MHAADHGLGLVADIGRQTVRFGLSERGGVPHAIRRYEWSHHPTFTSALLSYLFAEKVEGYMLPSAMAVAGAVRGDLINLTGSRWFVSLSGIEAVLRARSRAINECSACALALAALPATAFRSLTEGPAPAIVAGKTFLVLGPAVGFGVAALVSDGDRLVPVASEAAHTRFAPVTPDEVKLVARLRGQGAAATIEEMLAAEGFLTIQEYVTGRPGALRPEEFAQRVAQEPSLRRVLDIYADALGAAIGDLALAFAAWDGVFLVGPMMRALAPHLPIQTIMERARNKGPLRRQLAQLSLTLVLHEDLELLGATALLRAGNR